MDRPAQTALQGQPLLGLPAGRRRARGLRPGAEQTFRSGEAIRWIVRDARNRTVGRIAAFYNREKAALEEQPTGCCGFFEAIDDQQVADMLFDAARMWLASRGMEAMDGPVNFGQRRDWWGLLVEGFEFQPLYKNPYNPPYYKELFERYGFRNYFNQHSFIWRVNASEANKRATPHRATASRTST